MPHKKNYLLLLPIAGTLLFVLLYFVATLYYPGGSQADKNATGFSWRHNYWCNLLNDNAINGQPNPAKPIALTAMLILCLTLSFFWAVFPVCIRLSKGWKRIIQASGIGAMTIAFFLFTGFNHDAITNIASGLGAVAIIGTFVSLYRSKWYGLFTFGLLNILLVGVNNYCYYTPNLLLYLPVVQKITFAVFLLWICCIAFQLYRLQEKTATFEPAYS